MEKIFYLIDSMTKEIQIIFIEMYKHHNNKNILVKFDEHVENLTNIISEMQDSSKNVSPRLN